MAFEKTGEAYKQFLQVKREGSSALNQFLNFQKSFKQAQYALNQKYYYDSQLQSQKQAVEAEESKKGRLHESALSKRETMSREKINRENIAADYELAALRDRLDNSRDPQEIMNVALTMARKQLGIGEEASFDENIAKKIGNRARGLAAITYRRLGINGQAYLDEIDRSPMEVLRRMGGVQQGNTGVIGTDTQAPVVDVEREVQKYKNSKGY